MLSGLLILAATLLLLLALNYFSIRVFKLPAHKRERLRTIYLIIYGVLMSVLGISMLINDENSSIWGWLYILIGFGLPIANGMDNRKKNL